MLQVIIAALSLLPIAAALSKPRRMLARIRDETRTHDGLPENSKAREIMHEQLEGSVRRYDEYVGDEYVRTGFRVVGVGYLLFLACIAGLFYLPSDDLSGNQQALAVALFTLAAITGFWTLCGLIVLMDEHVSELDPRYAGWKLILPWAPVHLMIRSTNRQLKRSAQRRQDSSSSSSGPASEQPSKVD